MLPSNLKVNGLPLRGKYRKYGILFAREPHPPHPPHPPRPPPQPLKVPRLKTGGRFLYAAANFMVSMALSAQAETAVQNISQPHDFVVWLSMKAQPLMV